MKKSQNLWKISEITEKSEDWPLIIKRCVTWVMWVHLVTNVILHEKNDSTSTKYGKIEIHVFFVPYLSPINVFFSFDPNAMLLGAHLAWGRKINWSQIVWSRKWYKIKNCSFCIISLSRMHYFKNWSQILKGNAALQPANHLWAQFFPWQVHNSQKCIFVIFWHSHLVVVSGDHVLIDS